MTQSEQVTCVPFHLFPFNSVWGLVHRTKKGTVRKCSAFGVEHQMIWKLGSFTFVSVISFFTGFSVSHKSSDSRPSSTDLAGTKGGMFNLKHTNYFRPIFFVKQEGSFVFKVCLNHYAPPQEWKTKKWIKAIHFLSEENRPWKSRAHSVSVRIFKTCFESFSSTQNLTGK